VFSIFSKQKRYGVNSIPFDLDYLKF